MDEITAKAQPNYNESVKTNELLQKLIELQAKKSEKLDRQIELQEEENIINYESFQMLKCIKKGHKARGGRALYIMAFFAIASIAAEYFVKGEESVLFEIFKFTGRLI